MIASSIVSTSAGDRVIDHPHADRLAFVVEDAGHHLGRAEHDRVGAWKHPLEVYKVLFSTTPYRVTRLRLWTAKVKGWALSSPRSLRSRSIPRRLYSPQASAHPVSVGQAISLPSRSA